MVKIIFLVPILTKNSSQRLRFSCLMGGPALDTCLYYLTH